jgi:hypothetical protein
VKRRLAAGVALVAVGLALWVVLGPGARGPAARGNAVLVLNAGSRGVDSIVVEADPPGTHALAGRHGYLAPLDSALVALPGGRGDADVRVWRDGRVIANHLAYFGGRSVFEVRVGDSAQAGRYRRTN